MSILSGIFKAISAPFLGPLGPALVGGASQIIGAKVGSQSSYQVPDYAGIRSKAEAAGYSPLTALMYAPGQAVQSQNYMGQAIADAGMMLADSMAKNRAAGQVSKLQQANANLSKRVQNLTLRPKVGGIYAQRQAVPSMRAALGVSDASSSAVGGGAGDSGQMAARAGRVDLGLEPKQTNTFQTYINDGQSTDVPIGPDIDEVITGALISANNRDKAERLRLSRMTFGNPLSMRDGIEMPPGYQPAYPKSKKQKLKAFVGQMGWPLGVPTYGQF